MAITLHRHQRKAAAKALRGRSFVGTTGSGVSGAALAATGGMRQAWCVTEDEQESSMSQAPQGPFAHSLPGRPLHEWEPLAQHLHEVASGAAQRAERFGWAEVARVAGSLHDIGKCSARFQDYIRHPRPGRGGDHSTAGAVAAEQAYPQPLARLLALAVAGHHSGLADPGEIERRLGSAVPDHEGWEAHAGPLPPLKALQPTRPAPPPSLPWLHKGFSLSFMARMLFSCLVDADFICTETFMRGGRLPRGSTLDMAALRDRLVAHLGRVRADAKPTELNRLRAEILDHALGKAGDAPGFFTLTVPTGGGKTFASLAFALEHAVLRGKRRVVVVAPFTAIIEQTADVYRKALGDRDAVLEHHASFDWEDAAQVRGDTDDAQEGLGRLRRAAENWDAPVVVTTAVQFFESLYANRTSRCRKLHNLADSVIVLDEAQTVPVPLLLPCLAALDELQRSFGASVVLCTATQPAWRQKDGALVEDKADGTRVNLGLPIAEDRELAPHPRALYERLRRVRVEVLPDPVDDATLAAAFADAPQMLCIVNSRAHARAVFERIKGLEGARHLTTLMCPAHRRMVLQDVRDHLKAGLMVRLVATSLIEAGVDISFPEVWRASAGLDSVAQAAGRCNREGELPGLGRMVVFTPADGKPPPTAMRSFQAAARSVLRDHADPLGFDTMTAYFRELYFQRGAKALDATKIKEHEGAPSTTGILCAIHRAERLRVPFRTIAESFHMIDEAMPPVLVPWDERARKALDDLAAGRGSTGKLLRHLQSYTVPVPAAVRMHLVRKGILAPVRRDLGDAVLRLVGLEPFYRRATGLDLSDGLYRTAEENIL